MTRTTRIRGSNRTTRHDGAGDHAETTRCDTDGDGEDHTATVKMEAARKTKRRHGQDDGDRKDEEDEDETTKAKIRRTMKMGRGGERRSRKTRRPGMTIFNWGNSTWIRRVECARVRTAGTGGECGTCRYTGCEAGQVMAGSGKRSGEAGRGKECGSGTHTSCEAGQGMARSGERKQELENVR